MKSFINRNKLWFVAFVCFICFLNLVENVFDQDIMKWDVMGYKVISQLISNTMTPIAKFITNFGGATFIIVVTCFVVVCIRERKLKLLIPLNLIIVAGLNQLFKNLLQRPRPTGLRFIDESGYSFPSGHSMVSMAFYGYFIYLIYKNVENQYCKWILIIALSCLIVCIGVSRIYLGVHYTSDVLAGFVFSIMYLIIFIKTTENIGGN